MEIEVHGTIRLSMISHTLCLRLFGSDHNNEYTTEIRPLGSLDMGVTVNETGEVCNFLSKWISCVDPPVPCDTLLAGITSRVQVPFVSGPSRNLLLLNYLGVRL